MKLLNQSIKHTSISILLIIGVWGFVFFYNMTEEIKENVDEGLDNYKRQIIYRAHKDTTMLSQINFDQGFHAIHEIDKSKALTITNRYIDTLIYIQSSDDLAPQLDPVRMLVTAFKDNDRYYELKIINPMVEKDDLIHRLFLNMIWLYAFLIIAIILINNLVLQHLWNPFYGLLRQLQTYRLGSGEAAPSVKTKTKEFMDLQEAVGTLLNHNLQVYEQQKQFIGNASHELQTPLAIAVNKLELFLEKSQLEADQAENIEEILTIIERLIRLNKSLLLLTKIENGQFIKSEPVEINKTVEQAINDLDEIFDFKKVEVTLVEESKIIQQMDPALADILINNLLRNALFHNIFEGKIQVSLKNNLLVIANTSKESALDAQEIFKRFYKSANSKEGTGLGLSIIKAICNLYRISLSYSYRHNRHYFELFFESQNSPRDDGGH